MNRPRLGRYQSHPPHYGLSMLLVMAIVALFAGCNAQQDPTTTVLAGGTIITMSNAGEAFVGDVVVTDGIISHVREANRSGSGEDGQATFIDCEGKYLLPGLADMHTHFFRWDTEYWPVSPRDLYVAYGVTTVRICNAFSSPPDVVLSLGARPTRGPNVITCSNEHMDDPVGSVTNGEAAFLKVKDITDPSILEVLMQEAEARGVYTVGHLSGFRDLQHALDSGLDEVAHIRELGRTSTGDRWISLLLNSGAAVDTTLGLFEGIFEHVLDPDGFLESRESHYLPTAYRESLENRTSTEFGVLSEEWGGLEYQHELYRQDLELLIRLHKAGVPLLACTDSGAAYYGTVPGMSMLRELRVLVENGFTADEAIACATRTAGEVAAEMGLTERFGTLQPGSRADVLVLSSDPRSDIDALSRLAGVMVAGKWYDKEFIEQIKAR